MGAKSSKRRDPSIVTQTDDVHSLRFQYVKDNTRDIFNAIDSDKSGFLDKNEILAFYKKIGIGNKFAENDVEDIDEDSDGRVRQEHRNASNFNIASHSFFPFLFFS